MKLLRLLPPLVFLSLPSCKDVTRFSTDPGEAYCGQIVKGQFVRSGFAPSVRLRLTFDANRIDDGPGFVSTDDGMFEHSPLRPIPELTNDPLWTLNFGEGREKNLMYVLSPTLATGGPSLTAVLSFLHDGDAEVRLMRGAPSLDGSPPSSSDGKALFGVFAPLHRGPES